MCEGAKSPSLFFPSFKTYRNHQHTIVSHMSNKEERKPEFRYNGQYVMDYTKNNVVGDTAWDCDYGYLKWDGTKWKQYNPK